MDTSLHWACGSADVAALHKLLEGGAEVNAKDEKGRTPLGVLGMLPPADEAKENAITAMAQLLLEHRARVNRSARETTALLEAIRNRHYGMVHLIIDSGSPLDSTNKDGENALHLACYQAGDAACSIRQMQRTIEGSIDPWSSEKLKEQLRQELEKRLEEEDECNRVVKKLLESGQFDLDDKDESGRTALDYAMEYGARWAGALLAGQDPVGDELAVLIGGMDIFQALFYQDMDALDALLRAGTELQTVCEEERMTHFYGRTPLACALVGNHIEAAEKMLGAGADPNFKLPDEHTAFAVWMATDRDTDEKLCLSLLQRMTQSGWLPEQAVDGEGNTALSLACRRAGREKGRAAIRYLVGIQADVNARNLQGQTPMMNLYGGRFWDGHIPLFPGLPRGYPYEGRTCREEDAEMLELLLEAGAEGGGTDKWGNTVLHYIAASARNVAAKAAVEVLFDFGRPDVEAVNNEGLTAMDMATGNNDEILLKCLLKYT